MDLGIPIISTVESAIQLYRTKRHKNSILQMIDKEVRVLKNRGFNQQDDV